MRWTRLFHVLVFAILLIAGCSTGPDSQDDRTPLYVRPMEKTTTQGRTDPFRIDQRMASILVEQISLTPRVRLVAPFEKDRVIEIQADWELYCEKTDRVLEVSPGTPEVEFGGSVTQLNHLVTLEGWYARGDVRGTAQVEGEVRRQLDAVRLCKELALQLLADCYPKDLTLLLRLGIAQKQAGLPSRAIATYRKVIEKDPDNASAHFNIALAYEDIGEIDKAIEVYEEITRFRPDYYQAWYNLGLNHLLPRKERKKDETAEEVRARMEKGETCLRRAVKLAPRNKDARSHLAETYAILGKHNEALAECRYLIDHFPGDSTFFILAGSVALKSGNAEEALRYLLKAAEIEPLAIANDYNLAMAYDALEKWDEARDHYRRFIDHAGTDAKFQPMRDKAVLRLKAIIDEQRKK